jgi:hypothetical protein
MFLCLLVFLPVVYATVVVVIGAADALANYTGSVRELELRVTVCELLQTRHLHVRTKDFMGNQWILVTRSHPLADTCKK